jgi:WD40 repeat protein
MLYNYDCLNHKVLFESYNDENNKKKPPVHSPTHPRPNRRESSSSNDSDCTQEPPETSNRSDEYEKLEILCLKINQNSNIIVTGDSDGGIQAFDVFSCGRLKASSSKTSNLVNVKDQAKFAMSIVYNMPTICIKWHPYSNFSANLVYYACVNGYIGMFDVNSFDRSIVIQEPDEISCIDFNSDGSCFASVGKDCLIRLYDSNLNGSFHKLVKTLGNLKEPDFNPTSSSSSSPTALISSHSGRLQSVKFSNESNDLLFTGGWDRTVKMWDRRTEKGIVNNIVGPFLCGSDALDVKVFEYVQ